MRSCPDCFGHHNHLLSFEENGEIYLLFATKKLGQHHVLERRKVIVGVLEYCVVIHDIKNYGLVSI